MSPSDTRCPLCFRGGFQKRDGTFRPHRRLSSGPKGSRWVWCRKGGVPADDASEGATS